MTTHAANPWFYWAPGIFPFGPISDYQLFFELSIYSFFWVGNIRTFPHLGTALLSPLAFFRIDSNWKLFFIFSFGECLGFLLGGACYIHLTTRTNAVFSGFSTFLAPAAISMNSITLVMNFHCILFWHSGQSLLESNSDLSLLNFHKSQPWLNLRRTPLYPFN